MVLKKWFGTWPAKCDLCSADLSKHPTFIDGRTQAGPWAMLCEYCHFLDGVGVGPGRGQVYDSNTLEKLEG